MEKTLISAMMGSRSSFSVIYDHLNLKQYSRQFQILFENVRQYYDRDSSATFVDRNILVELIATTLLNPKHVEDFTRLIDESLAVQVSEPNIKQVVLLAKQQEVGELLAQAIANKSEGISELLDSYQTLRKATELETLGSGLEVFSQVDLQALIEHEYDPASFLKVYPQSLNDRLDGGAKGGHHIVAYGRPEAGKSMFAINAACGFARHGHYGLYFINEDRPKDIILRITSNLTGMNKHQIRDEPKLAQKMAYEAGFDKIIVVNCAPGTPNQIMGEMEKHSECKWVVIDQLRNLKVKSDNRTNQLESAATAVRNIAKVTNTVALSVTQAGDSASGKKVLDQGDVDSSNTGIPAQADLMVGIGIDMELEQASCRMISLPKNKLSGDHSSFPVKVDPFLSRYRSV